MAKKDYQAYGNTCVSAKTLATPAEKIYNIIDRLNSNASDSLAPVRKLSQQCKRQSCASAKTITAMQATVLRQCENFN